MQTYPNPPAVTNATEPYIIIGVDMKEIFHKHYRATYDLQTRDEFNNAVKDIPYETRKKIGEIWKELNDQGWRARGLDERGNIIWSAVLVANPIDISEFKGMSDPEIIAHMKTKTKCPLKSIPTSEEAW